MPRFTKTVNGSTGPELEKRFEPALANVDGVRETIVERAAVLEQMHLRVAKREESRLVYKFGSDSSAAAAAAERVQTAERRLVALQLETERLRIEVVTADPQSVVVHGRALDANREALSNVTVAVISPTAARATARAKTDENGYFKLTTKPIAEAPVETAPATESAKGEPTAAPAKGGSAAPAKGDSTRAAPRRPMRLVVLEGTRELYSEDLEPLQAGQVRYREIVVRPAR